MLPFGRTAWSALPCGLAMLGAVLLAACAATGGCSSADRASTLAVINAQSDPLEIIPLLADKRAWVREHAALRLGVLGSEEAAPVLAAVLRGDGSPWVRVRAAEALGRIGMADSVRPLADALGDEDPNVQCAAMQALALIGDDSVLARVVGMTKSPNPLVRGCAEAVIRTLEEGQ
jgi:HEAT repeat protein